jgi:aromatic ring-opening dioxygenase catalytic subunit (LigB family)
MSHNDEITRRQGLAAAAAIGTTALSGSACSPGTTEPRGDASGTKTSSSSRMPVVFLPHGGGPWPFVETPFGDRSELDALAGYLRSLKDVAPAKPKALLVVSAHWEEDLPTVMASESPPLFFDYYGFPPESYRLTWPAPGAPALASRVRELLGSAGFDSSTNGERGFDHGTFVPLKLTFPEADVPTIQLSLKKGLDPAEHLAIGRALAPLRDEGVLIVGSGMTYHNLRALGPAGRAPAEAFDTWLVDSVTATPAVRNERLTAWESAPSARAAHPREEHLLPLMVIAGAAGEDPAVVGYAGTILGLRISAFHFGVA